MERLGRYLLLERIATGGMGEVYRAAVLGPSGFYKQVAIKRIHPHLASDESAANMLTQEARLVSELDHPNIIRVLELGQQVNTLFLAMDYVAGQTVSHVIGRSIRAKRKLPVGFVLYVVHQTLQGLAYAHSHTDSLGNPLNIIHRDISPQNIMLSYEGAVQLVDFGIARATGQVQQTVQGGLRGKPGYFSPEMVKGQTITQAADIYAMGVVLYEMLTLRPMRVISTATPNWWEAYSKDPAPIETVCAELPAGVCAVVNRAVATDPAARYATAAAFAQAVLDVAQRTGQMWSRAEAQVLMSQLFFDDIERELRCRVHYRSEALVFLGSMKDGVSPYHAANHGTGVDMVDGFRPTASMDVPNAVPVPTPRRMRWKPVLLATGLLGALATLTASSVSMAGRNATEPVPVTTPAPEPPKNPNPDPPAVVVPQPVAHAPAAVAPPPEPVLPLAKQERGLRKGRLSVQSTPWARVFIDGKDTGRYTPLIQYPVSAGRHRVQLSNDEMSVKSSFTFTVKPGAEVVRVVTLR